MIEIHGKYKPLYTSASDLIIITGGRGSGKSFTVADWACRSTFQKDELILYTRYTLTSAKDSIIPEYKDKIDLFNAEDMFKITGNEIVNNITTSKILFKGIKNSSGNQTANLKSIKDPTKWICDEAAEIPDYDTFQKIRRSLRKKDANIQTILLLNPEGTSHWIYKTFFEDKNIPDYFNGISDGITYIHTSYLDNIINLDKTFLKDAENTKEKNEAEYENIFLGKWGDYLVEMPFPKSKLNFSNFLDLPGPSIILSFTDPADGGDFYATIIVYIINNEAYIYDVIFRKCKMGEGVELTGTKILEHNVKNSFIEINKGGSLLITSCVKYVNNENYKVFPINETMNKEYRIGVYSDYIVSKVNFRNDYKRGSDYDLFINNLTSYSNDGKNKNDDAPDVLAALSKYMFQIMKIK